MMNDTKPEVLHINYFSDNTFIVTTPPKQRYRCTKGHEWTEESNWGVGTRCGLTISVGEVKTPAICMLCIADFLTSGNFGVVAAIPPEPAADVPTVVEK